MKKLIYFPILSLIMLFAVACNKPATTAENAENDTIETVAEPIVQTNSAAEILAKKQVPVLCYHRIENGRNDEYTVSPATFKAQIQALADSGFHTILPDEYYDYLVYNKELPEKPVMITFDDSRVEHATIAAPVLEQHGFRGVFFIMTITYNKRNYMSTDQLAELAKNGHSVSFHSWDHTRATRYDNDSILRVNVTEPLAKLEEIIGEPVEYFAYPYGLTDTRTTAQMHDHFKMSFILSTERDSVYPLQTVRRMIACEWKPQSLMNIMERTFSHR